MDFELVTKIACRLQAISNFAYDIHYNARGNDFYENHLFAERIGDQYETSAFKDEIFETVFLGRGVDVPPSKDIENGVLVLTPESQKNEESDYKLLRGMITACLEDIENLSGLSLGEGDLFGRIASLLQRHNGLLFARLSYGESEVVANSGNEEEGWKHLMNANDDDIKEWITVKGNHIPIMKGETKEEATKKFIEKQEQKERPTQKGTSDIGERFNKLLDEGGSYEDEDVKQVIRELAKEGYSYKDVDKLDLSTKNTEYAKKKLGEGIYTTKDGGAYFDVHYEDGKFYVQHFVTTASGKRRDVGNVKIVKELDDDFEKKE